MLGDVLLLVLLPGFEVDCPVCWREPVKGFGISTWKPFDDVGEVGLWVDSLGFGADEQRV